MAQGGEPDAHTSPERARGCISKFGKARADRIAVHGDGANRKFAPSPVRLPGLDDYRTLLLASPTEVRCALKGVERFQAAA